MASLLPNTKLMFLGNDGKPLVGGKIYTFDSGTNTPRATYADAAGSTLNTNPIILDSRGEALVFWNGSYRVRLCDAFDNILWTADSISEINLSYRTGSNGSVIVPYGTTLQRDPAPQLGYLRYNLDLNIFEGYTTSGWVSIAGAAAGNNSDITKLNALTSMNGGQLAGFRNRLINGAMLIAQRGTSGTVTAGTSTPGLETGYVCVDRFYIHCAGANVTAAQVNGADATSKRLQVTGAASVTSVGIGQRIESVNSYDLAGNVCTFAVDISNSLLTQVTWTAYYANTADNFGMLASPTKTQIAQGIFTVNSSIARYSAQIAIPSAAVTGIEIVLTVGAQTSGTWVVGKPQLELGSVATSFEHRPYYLEMVLCQRYCELISCIAETTFNHTIYMKAAKFAPLGVQLTTVSLSAGTGFTSVYITGGGNLNQNGANSQAATAVIRASSEIF